MLTYFKTFAAINYLCEDIHTFRFVPGLAFTLYCTPPVHIRHVRVHTVYRIRTHYASSVAQLTTH